MFQKRKRKKLSISCVGKKPENSSCMIFHHNLQFLVYQKGRQVRILLQLSRDDSWLFRNHSQWK